MSIVKHRKFLAVVTTHRSYIDVTLRAYRGSVTSATYKGRKTMAYIKKPSKEIMFKKILQDTSVKGQRAVNQWLNAKKYERESGISKAMTQRLAGIVMELSSCTSFHERCLLGLKIELAAKEAGKTRAERFEYALMLYAAELKKRAAGGSSRNKQ